MNWIDILLIVIIILAMFAGWNNGFLLESLNLLTWIGSLVLAYIFYPYPVNWIDKVLDLDTWLLPVSFLLTAIMAGILLSIIKNYIVRLIPEKINVSRTNKLLGIIPGTIHGWIYAIVISALLLALPIKDGLTTEMRASRFAEPLAMQSEWANRKLAPVFNDAIRQTMNSLTVKPGSGEKVSLGFTYKKAVADPELEREMLKMINEERKKNNLGLLKADPEMTAVARAHSKDMFERGYFAHVNPDGKNPFDRMKAAKVSFIAAGENLALAQTVAIAHINLMNSPGHRANILNPAFGRLGIGILDGGYYGLMISQEFRN